VQTLSGAGGKWQITNGGGHSPVWSPDGSAIYYVADETVATLAVSVDDRPGLQAGPAREVLRGPYEVRTEPVTNYDVSPDGRIVMVRSSPRENTTRRLSVMLNWASTRLSRSRDE